LLTHLSIASYVVWKNVAGDLVLFDERDGAYHALNAAAASIWRRVADGRAVPAIIDELSAEFGAARDVVSDDVTRFIDEAVGKGLLIQGEAP
jgi:hypothetical protein